MNWSVQGFPKGTDYFGLMIPSEVLIWYDGPRTFVFKDTDDLKCLAHWIDESHDASRFVVVQISDRHLQQLDRGELTIIECLDQPRVFVVEIGHNGVVSNVWLTKLDAIPSDVLPHNGTMIRRELEPFFSLRAIGPAINPGEIPGSVIKTTVECAQKAIKCLAEYEMNIFKTRGQPSRALKELYDLPAQKLLAASFEVQFRSPLTEPDLFSGLSQDIINEEFKVLRKVGEHLRKGLDWLRSDSPSNMPVEGNQLLSQVIVESMKYLTPPTRGDIEIMEVRGESILSTSPIKLTRNFRKKANFADKAIKTWGKSKSIEKTCTIIDIYGEDARILVKYSDTAANAVEVVCQFSDELWDEYGEQLRYNQDIKLWGVQGDSNRPITILEINFLEDEPE